MQPTEFIWHKGKFVKWEEATVHFLTHTFHYGDGAFEGIRAYETAKGAAVFRLKEHMERLVYSAGALRMELPYSVEELCSATVQLIKANKLKHCYIRPVAFYDYGVMGLNPRDSKTEVTIACWPWGAYLPPQVDVKVSSLIRIHPRSTIADAKLCGHYINSMMAVFEIRGTKYHEALLCDEAGNIMEGPGENFFMVEKGNLITPPLGPILSGITRATVIEFARDCGLGVTERNMTVTEAKKSDEAFFTGTAAEVTPIRSIDDVVLGDGTVGPITGKLKDLYHQVVQGKSERYDHYLTYV